MNTLRWPFPALTPAAVAQASTIAACARAGITPTWQPLPARGAVLRFDVSGHAGDLRLVVPAEQWCPAMLPAMAGFAWSELVDRNAVACWLPDQPLLDISAAAFHGAAITLRDVVPVTALALASGPQPCLDTAQGPAWIERADCAAGTGLTPAMQALRLPVELGIARLRVSLHRLRTLPPGAVLLLDQLHPVARYAQRRLYSFDFTLETISVNTPFDFLDDDDGGTDIAAASATAAATADAAHGIDIRRLPVAVDVVLCQLQHAVGELDRLQPGTVFNLPDDAWKHLQLRVNGQLIARGELVQVGDQLGVQLAQAPVLT
ncbi:FliM/FliN family flagellar motor switch protein [uncultured Stenotrophomonas sp.]|uniref:FliM/FliN family flagellar motor switch protein n=1 Tax=uncultured Stenotrophomonas sp. TaxID=165438 RepID=UPI0028E4AC6F|nr:FliM/FliN family flagellar motor switch protein [uncultured Stenotrophomonas sp.]